MANLGITISSRAMFSSWTYHQPTRSAFDSGEGLSLHLLTRIFGIRNVFVSHGHQDHVGGLATLIGLRAKLKGDTAAPLTIYGPHDNLSLDRLRQYIEWSWPELPYELSWHYLIPGQTVQLDKSHRIECFPMAHQRNATTLGYRLAEERKRLIPSMVAEIKGMVGSEVGARLAALRAAGQVIDEVYHTSTFCYALDTYQLNPAEVVGADLVVADCTFLDVSQRDEQDKAHASLDESAKVCADAGVKHMICAHVSLRNNIKAVVKRAAELEQELGLKITVCDPSTILTL